MENIIEYINVNYNKELYNNYFEKISELDHSSYIECGVKSWVLKTNNRYETILETLLNQHKKVHPIMCHYGTGFNYSSTKNHTLPPHIDIEKPKYFNLLLPIFGTAVIEIFKTDDSELEYRHGQKHWKMLQKEIVSEKIGELLVNKPVLLDTNYLHNVKLITAPRLVWCSRWIEIDESYTFASFKKHIENVLNG